MRRFLVLFLLLTLACLPARAGLAQDAMGQIFDAVDALKADSVAFETVGPYLCVTAQKEETVPRFGPARLTYGLAFDSATGARVTWDDLFADGDAAATRLEEIARNAENNAYADFDRIAPMPRDNFTLTASSLTVWYPVTQFSCLSGRQAGFEFLAYELDGLLREGAPLTRGDVSGAQATLEAALSTGTLPFLPPETALGGPVSAADEAFGLVDVPDVLSDAAVYSFEAPALRGVSLLSAPDDADAQSATITGVWARRFDFSGLCAGVSTQAECLAALRAPDERIAVESPDAYDRLPAGETCLWRGDTATLEMHFSQGILYSIALLFP